MRQTNIHTTHHAFQVRGDGLGHELSPLYTACSIDLNRSGILCKDHYADHDLWISQAMGDSCRIDDIGAVSTLVFS
jgi:hypothetical protein